MAASPDRVTAYATRVDAGKVPCGRYVRLAATRHISDRKQYGTKEAGGLWFDRVASESAIDFFQLLRHSKGQWAGQQFELAPWQAFVVGSLFGWKRGALRRFRIAYNEVPRKNGKSTLSAGIALLLAFFDDEPGAEVVCAATKKDQARVVFDECKRMVERTPALKSKISAFATSLTRMASSLKPLSADHDTMDGLNIHGAVIDELHAHKTSGVVDVLETATGARRQPLQFEITTAGYDRTSICWKHHDYAVKVLEGVAKDDTFFAYIAGSDPDDDWMSPVTWEKANPNLGVSVHFDDLERKAAKAAHIPAQQNAFRRLHLNQWTEQADRWLDMSVWDTPECSAPVDEDELAGRECFVALDMASARDIAAFVLLFGPDDDGAYDVLPRFWVPEETLAVSDGRRSERDRLMLAGWAAEGFIRTTPGNVNDYDFVEQAILEDAEKFNFREMAFDRWGVTQLITHLQEQFGDSVPVVGVGQGFQSMAAPTKEIEKLLLSKRLRHGGNPVLRWMASNVAVRQDPAGNLKIDKAKSAEKVDGMVALAMALGRAMVTQDEPASIYETRGPLTGNTA